MEAWDHFTLAFGENIAALPQVLRFIPATIAAIVGGARMPTTGSDVRLIGQNFGSLDSVLAAVYDNGVSGPKAARACRFVTSATTEVLCTAVEGSGVGYRWALVVDGIVGVASTAMTNYAPPAILDLRGDGTASLTRSAGVCVTSYLSCVLWRGGVGGKIEVRRGGGRRGDMARCKSCVCEVRIHFSSHVAAVHPLP